jgi:alkylation response protein AidB-like acyl-CoA dehydrogenase
MSGLPPQCGADGVKSTPIHTLDDGRTSAMYLSDVRVPAANIVGDEHHGWRVMTSQLNHERVALACPGKSFGLFDDVVAWAKQTGAIERAWVHLALAQVKVKLEALRLLNWRMVWAMSNDALNPADASVVKVFGTETFIETFRILLEIVGAGGTLASDSPGSLLAGRIDHAARWSLILTFGGGVNEVQREIIAQAGLGMPRGAR